MEIKGISIYTFPEDEPSNSTELLLPVLDYETFEETGVLTEDDSKYFVGVRYEGTETVTLGFDANINYDRTVVWKEMNGDTSALNEGLLLADTWTPEGVPDVVSIAGAYGLSIFGPNTVTATGVYLSPLVGTEEIAGVDKFEMNLFPNPVKDQLQVNVNFKEKAAYVEYYAFDAAGRLVLHKRETNVLDATQASFDASQLPAGEYHLVIRTDLGIQAKPFVVSR